MALNKTPSAHSGYFSELTASAGKQSNFLFPVRIKMTPNTSMRPMSDGKKNSKKMLKPVLIKDLFQSTQKDRQNTTITSVSTQKKRGRSTRDGQPYLNTQSCYKPKQDEVENSTLFSQKSSGNNKVRRQLYQVLDSPQRLALESKDNVNKNLKPKRLNTNKNLDETITRNTKVDNPARKSLLLPPNTIRNTFLRQSESNLRPTGKQTVKSGTVNKATKNVSQVTEPKRRNVKSNNTRDSNKTNKSVPNYVDDTRQSPIKQDISTMTSPYYNWKTPSSKVFSNTSIFERPSVIISPSGKNSLPNGFNSVDPLCKEMQGLNVNRGPCFCSQGVQLSTAFHQNPMFDFSKLNVTDCSGYLQIKSFLEQSLRASENQTLQLKQAINCIDDIISKSKITDSTIETNATPTVQNDIEDDKKYEDPSCSIKTCEDQQIISNTSQDTTIDINKSSDKFEIYHDNNDTLAEMEKIKISEISTINVENLMPRILINDVELTQESKEASLEMSTDIARLSTIGEVSCEISCELNEPNKSEKNDVEDNKENQQNSTNKIKRLSTTTPRTPKTPRRRTIAVTAESCDSGSRRRSARLAKKRLSQSNSSDSEKMDSFTQLENELNLESNSRLKSSKSLPASPIKDCPLTPATLRQWDKRIERPLKEYMAMKVNGSFLVTPDVKKFQSRLEPTDTPHSRKSLSRKIFMELCDLYAESPDHN